MISNQKELAHVLSKKHTFFTGSFNPALMVMPGGNPLMVMPVEAAAQCVAEWIFQGLGPWPTTQKGGPFWESFHTELSRIQLGGQP